MVLWLQPWRSVALCCVEFCSLLPKKQYIRIKYFLRFFLNNVLFFMLILLLLMLLAPLFYTYLVQHIWSLTSELLFPLTSAISHPCVLERLSPAWCYCKPAVWQLLVLTKPSQFMWGNVPLAQIFPSWILYSLHHHITGWTICCSKFKQTQICEAKFLRHACRASSSAFALVG